MEEKTGPPWLRSSDALADPEMLEDANLTDLNVDHTESSWPGLNDAPVVVRMLEDPNSLDWIECNNLVTHLVNEADVPHDFKVEIIQRTMIAIHNSLSHFRYKSRLTTWIITIIRNKRVDLLREQSRDRKKGIVSLDAIKEEGDESEMRSIAIPGSTEANCIRREELREVLHKIETYLIKHKKHSERDAEIIRMVLFQAFTCEETASHLHIDRQQVYQVIHGLRQHLLKRI